MSRRDRVLRLRAEQKLTELTAEKLRRNNSRFDDASLKQVVSDMVTSPDFPVGGRHVSAWDEFAQRAANRVGAMHAADCNPDPQPNTILRHQGSGDQLRPFPVNPVSGCHDEYAALVKLEAEQRTQLELAERQRSLEQREAYRRTLDEQNAWRRDEDRRKREATLAYGRQQQRKQKEQELKDLEMQQRELQVRADNNNEVRRYMAERNAREREQQERELREEREMQDAINDEIRRAEQEESEKRERLRLQNLENAKVLEEQVASREQQRMREIEADRRVLKFAEERQKLDDARRQLEHEKLLAFQAGRAMMGNELRLIAEQREREQKASLERYRLDAEQKRVAKLREDDARRAKRVADCKEVLDRQNRERAQAREREASADSAMARAQQRRLQADALLEQQNTENQRAQQLLYREDLRRQISMDEERRRVERNSMPDHERKMNRALLQHYRKQQPVPRLKLGEAVAERPGNQLRNSARRSIFG